MAAACIMPLILTGWLVYRTRTASLDEPEFVANGEPGYL
jgi:hypothetical protein